MLETLFQRMGYVEVARHKTKDISLYRQGTINYVLNREPTSHAARFVAEHGPCAPAMAWRVVDAKHALKRAVDLGAKEYTGTDKSLDVPAVVGIGGSLLYFVDTYGAKGSPYARDYTWLGAADPKPEGVGFHYIDHLTHNVMRGNMDTWYRFYAETFNFREIRFFNIEGKVTGLHSRALTSPCGKIRIPINESADDKSQIEEYLQQYKGEGIQHIAVGADDIYAATDAIAARGLEFMPGPPDAYYDKSVARVKGHTEPIDAHEEARHPDRWRRRGRRRHHAHSAADLLQDRHRPDLLRVHPAQGRRRFRRGQLQGPVREHRRRPDPPRRAEGVVKLAPRSPAPGNTAATPTTTMTAAERSAASA